MAEVKGPDTLYADLSDPDSWTTYLTEEEAQAARTRSCNSPTASASRCGTGSHWRESTYNSWFVDQVFRDVTADLVEAKGISTEEAGDPDLQWRLSYLHHPGPGDSGDRGVRVRGPGESE